MPKKPSELINGEVNREDSSASRQQSAGGWLTLIVVALACVLGYLTVSRMDSGDRDQDRREQKRDDQKQDDKKQDAVVVRPGYLHVVRERIDDVASNESVSRIAEFAAKHEGVQWRDSDKDDPSEAVQKMVKHAKSKGVDPPFLLFKAMEGNQLGNVIKLPPASATDAQLMEVFKQ